MLIDILQCMNNWECERNLLFFSDINECDEGTSGCAQNCHDNVGSFTCSCNAGYFLNNDQRTCGGESYRNITMCGAQN